MFRFISLSLIDTGSSRTELSMSNQEYRYIVRAEKCFFALCETVLK